MAKRDLLKLPDDFEGNMRALLATPPAPAGTAGSRKTAPKPPAKPKRKWQRHEGPKAPPGTYAYEAAKTIGGKRPDKRRGKKAAKKR